jgi:hypothetical protein
MGLFKALQEARRQASTNTYCTDPKTDREPTGDDPGCIARCRRSAVKRAKGVAGAVEEDLTRRRECDPAAVALKQLHPERLLQLADLGAENLLRHMDTASAGGETGFLGDSYEVAEMAHLDVHRGRC